MNNQDIMNQLGLAAKNASLFNLSTKKKNEVLSVIADLLLENKKQIFEANRTDVKAAKAKNLSPIIIDRLQLDEGKILGLARSFKDLVEFGDPVGKVLDSWERPNGLKISKVSVPIGVIGMIYESRPNVTADASAICIKSGNAIILRGGSESFNSSNKIVEIIRTGLKKCGINPDLVQIVPTTDREAVKIMLGLKKYIDLIIPRGGESLTRLVDEESKIPTLLHLTGNCHTYIHTDADFNMARNILLNAKLRRTSICGATESLIIDSAIAQKILPLIAEDLKERNCEIRGDATAKEIVSWIKAANEEDWGKEYLDSIISVKIVENVEEAVSHINQYGSHHTDAIITENTIARDYFLQNVDSASCLHNTSTQFADGYEFGLGAEIGIATGKLHARGPVSIEQLTTYKYIVLGEGQVRD